jgi:hypothetical protein
VHTMGRPAVELCRAGVKVFCYTSKDRMYQTNNLIQSDRRSKCVRCGRRNKDADLYVFGSE